MEPKYIQNISKNQFKYIRIVTNNMSDTNNLIKDVAVDLICVTTMWALLNNPYMALNYYPSLNNSLRDITPMCTMLLGFGISAFAIKKYC